MSSPTRVFLDDPLRLLRAVRFEDELGFRMDERTEALLRASAALVTQPAGERVLAELQRLSAAGYRRLRRRRARSSRSDGALDDRLDALDDPDFRLVVVFGDHLTRLPISNELEALRAALRRARRRTIRRRARSIASGAARSRGRSTRSPTSARRSSSGVVEAARLADPSAPLVRGDELGLDPGPAIGRILDVIDEERAAGTISTREEALELARSLASAEAAT